MKDIYSKIIELKESGTNAMLCTIVQTKGSTPLKAGAKMLVVSDNIIYGTVGGGSIENQTITNALELAKTNKSNLLHIELISKEGTSCGGTAEIFIEPIMNTQKLYIFGAGHVGKALVQHLENIDFDITVIDDRQDIFNDWIPGNYKKVTVNIDEFLNQMQFEENIFIAIITYDHKIDWQILSFCADKKWKYLGMMGSKSKVKQMKNKLLEMDIKSDIISKINMPIGLEINDETANEIAISIAGEMIFEKNKLRK
ncbi:MAG: hypothetical protein A2X64_08470 [Ignavibacteria bacterium GWF2_33_9]|nr:MAG: hypothetical protein A2X64_08470 [Ignavibacteria bacterium GWF2_33_9]